MSTSNIVELAKAGKLSNNAIRIATKGLIEKQDPAAAGLLALIGDRALWRLWGYKSMMDYCILADIPESIARLTSMYCLIEELGKPRMNLGHNKLLRQAIITLYHDQPLQMDHDIFLARLKAIAKGLDKAKTANGNRRVS